MKPQVVRYGVVPFLFGFLLLGGMSQPRHHGSGAAAPPQTVAPAPHLQRALGDGPGAASSEPLPVYVPEPDDAGCSGVRVCVWSA